MKHVLNAVFESLVLRQFFQIVCHVEQSKLRVFNMKRHLIIDSGDIKIDSGDLYNYVIIKGPILTI